MRGLGVTLLLLCACGRTEPVHFTVEASPPDAAVDAGDDAGIDAGLDAGVDAGLIDAGCSVVLERHAIAPATRRPIDILFIIDDSCSMADDQVALGMQFDAFFSAFAANQVDFHVGVATTDMYAGNRRGRLVGPVLTPSTPNLREAFMRTVEVGDTGSGDERGIDAARAALRYSFHPSPNDDLVRPEADFALVFVTDEDDNSIVTVDALTTLVSGLKRDPSAITVASILGLVSDRTCQPDAVSRWRYADFTRRFGTRGVLAICDGNYERTLKSIAGRALANLCLVGLSRPLAPGDQVLFGGQPATFTTSPPDSTYPFGSLELTPCPPQGGELLVVRPCE